MAEIGAREFIPGAFYLKNVQLLIDQKGIAFGGPALDSVPLAHQKHQRYCSTYAAGRLIAMGRKTSFAVFTVAIRRACESRFPGKTGYMTISMGMVPNEQCFLTEFGLAFVTACRAPKKDTGNR